MDMVKNFYLEFRIKQIKFINFLIDFGTTNKSKCLHVHAGNPHHFEISVLQEMNENSNYSKAEYELLFQNIYEKSKKKKRKNHIIDMGQSPCPSWRSKRNFKQSKQFSWIFVSMIKPKNDRNNIKVFKMEKKNRIKKAK